MGSCVGGGTSVAGLALVGVRLAGQVCLWALLQEQQLAWAGLEARKRAAERRMAAKGASCQLPDDSAGTP